MTGRVVVVALVVLTAAACTGGEARVAPAPSTTDPATSSTTMPTSTVSASTVPASTVPTSTVPASTVPPSTAPTTSVPAGPPELLIEGSPMIRFSVAVGDGIDDLTRDDLARFVVDTLADERSWIGRGAGFELLDEGGLFTFIVALPDDVDEMCAPLQTVGRFSCARNGWIAINSLRWFGATEDWPGDLVTYRRYLVNHEVGHYIHGPAHDSCPGPGEPAPIMMQQTKGLDGCEPNGWVVVES